MDKPDGPTSHDVVARVRRLFDTRAVGHTGTLDPFATGLLVLVLGRATRLARWAGGHPKSYQAEVRLGVTTSTDDRTGSIVAERIPAAWPSREALEAALDRLTGALRQRPPAYSAKRVAGVRSHRLARRGAEPVLEPAEVAIHRLELLEYAPPRVKLFAEVGPGTYLRALARDLGDALGTGAHLAELRRVRIGPWSVEEAHRLDALRGNEPLLPARELVGELPGIELTPEEVLQVGHGRDLAREEPTSGEAALLEAGELVAVAKAVPAGWHPAVVLR